jgi:hypothetical protein
MRLAALLVLIPLCASAAPHKKKRSRPVVIAQVDVAVPAPLPPPATIDLTPPRPRAVEVEVVQTRSRRWGLMSGGVALFAAAYVADIGVTFGFHHEPSGISAIPVIGPLIQCGDKYGYQGPMPMTGNPAVDKQMAEQIGQANTLIQTVTYVGLAVDFVGQAVGLTLAIVGATTHRSEWSRVTPSGNGFAVHF